MLYLAMMDITGKWTGRRQDWSTIYAQPVVFFGDRIPEEAETGPNVNPYVYSRRGAVSAAAVPRSRSLPACPAGIVPAERIIVQLESLSRVTGM